MERTKLTNKLIVLGVDGFEPSLAKKFMDKGVMPSLERYVKRGAARKDLVLLGCMPTVTPPMWTTLATGATPVVHGIRSFSISIRRNWILRYMRWIHACVRRSRFGMLRLKRD